MKWKIAIFGSSVGLDGKKDQIPKETAITLGEALAKNNVTIVTGACSGIPYQVALEAAKHGCDITGFSPEIDLGHQRQFTPDDDLSIYTKLVYVPKNFPFIKIPEVCRKYRNVISTATADAGLIIAGRWGTMNEFTNLYDMGKIIGVLTGTGGIADELPKLLKKIHKKTKAKVIFNNNPKSLVTNVLEELNK